jgi:hypothetical protein
MEKPAVNSRIPLWACVVICCYGVLCVLFGLFLPVLDDLCGPTADQEMQNKSPVFFWSCIAIPVLYGISLLIFGVYQARKTSIAANVL